MSSTAAPTFQIPLKLEDLGIPAILAEELFARRLMVEEVSTIGGVSEHLCVSRPVAQEIAESLRAKKQLEYLGSVGRDYRVALTDAGSKRISELMRNGSYVTPLPVPLEHYDFAVKAQTANIHINRETIRSHLSDLVVSDKLLDQLGPAFASQGVLFLYGPPGTGKTSLAERIGRLDGEHILIPRMVEVDTQLISVFDAAVHTPSPEQPEGLDPRWVVCQRPIIMVGGELQLDALDLQHDAISGLHTCSLQMLANNGTLVVDDFGRQSSEPEAILNRWILPLSTGVDYLRGRNGTKFTVPFKLKLVISTNLNPMDLGDEAFLRRLQNKIYIGPMDDEGFSWSLARAADRRGLKLTSGAASEIAAISRKNLGDLRPYIAVDFCEMAQCTLAYDGAEPVITTAVINRVADAYFVKPQPPPVEDLSSMLPQHRPSRADVPAER